MEIIVSLINNKMECFIENFIVLFEVHDLTGLPLTQHYQRYNQPTDLTRKRLPSV